MADPGHASYSEPHHHYESDPNRRLSQEAPHGLGETEEQHARHADIPEKKLWGMDRQTETVVFYIFFIISLCLLITAAALGSVGHSWSGPFVGVFTAFAVFHWAAWLQTAVGMCQRASWVRDEADLGTRRQFLFLAVRLNRMMLPTALVGFVVFLYAYARRWHLKDLAYWLLFLLTFIWNTVFSVMNAYNNITWESDRLEYEEGDHLYRISRLAIFGIPSPRLKEGKEEKHS
ncbi:hypothetical protein BAUCODRAFT_34738 [Baudoinia panamericana UAMH 10762]|uniref:Uncharacterized protein n=1 Tax=Baudoinia panamericana (strain UAMH 10762) TaxID=717646 RepID=M2MWQ8_BAUPA|nr:uncharacterized protein BAUCODRAFT_34738 [Baudoinia panamericana UAMH 10762]EMC95978.1 hypothetical protein BAUCODRAFT_34738 [Baudoinia panamericana UAMH 10762]